MRRQQRERHQEAGMGKEKHCPCGHAPRPAAATTIREASACRQARKGEAVCVGVGVVVSVRKSKKQEAG